MTLWRTCQYFCDDRQQRSPHFCVTGTAVRWCIATTVVNLQIAGIGVAARLSGDFHGHGETFVTRAQTSWRHAITSCSTAPTYRAAAAMLCDCGHTYKDRFSHLSKSLLNKPLCPDRYYSTLAQHWALYLRYFPNLHIIFQRL